MPVISHQVPLEQIYELNRLFLRYLQSCKRERMLTLGLPKKAVAPLQEASSGQLEAVAEFPRALFQLVLDDPNPVGGENIFDNASLPARILELTIAYSAWSTSRESDYHARLFFGFCSEVIHALRTTPLSELPRIAVTSVRIVCAFQEAGWLWRQLVVETRPEVRRQLVLVALQPPLGAARPSAGIGQRRIRGA